MAVKLNNETTFFFVRRKLLFWCEQAVLRQKYISLLLWKSLQIYSLFCLEKPFEKNSGWYLQYDINVAQLGCTIIKSLNDYSAEAAEPLLEPINRIALKNRNWHFSFLKKMNIEKNKRWYHL